LFQLTLAGDSLSLREAKAGIKREQEPTGGNWYKGHGRMLLSDFLPMTCFVCFLIDPRITSPGIESPTEG